MMTGGWLDSDDNIPAAVRAAADRINWNANWTPLENQAMTVYVLVFWPGNPEDRPPEILAVAASLDRAKQAAAEHARDELHIEPPAEWTIDDDDVLIGDVAVEDPDDGFYAEQRYAIHPKPVLQ